MEKKLENIFVPPNIGILAYNKGFHEWCAGLHCDETIVGSYGNTHAINPFIDETLDNEHCFDFEYTPDAFDGEYGLPTHFQLIAWLQSNHNIQITPHKEGGFTVFDKDGFMKFDKGKPRFEINKALEVALNTIKDTK